MHLVPKNRSKTEDYNGDYFWANNGAVERCAYRGGDWHNGANAGVFALYFYHPRAYGATSIGGLADFYRSK